MTAIRRWFALGRVAAGWAMLALVWSCSEVQPDGVARAIQGVFHGVLRDVFRAQDEDVAAANIAYQRGSYDRALQSYRRVMEDIRDDPQLLYNLGLALYRRGQASPDGERYTLWSEAARVLRRSAADTEAGIDTKVNASYSLGNVLVGLGAYDGAIEAYKRALRLRPDAQDARYNLEVALYLRNRDENLDNGDMPQPPADDSANRDNRSDSPDEEREPADKSPPADTEAPTPEAPNTGDTEAPTPEAPNTDEHSPPSDIDRRLAALERTSQTLRRRALVQALQDDRGTESGDGKAAPGRGSQLRDGEAGSSGGNGHDGPVSPEKDW